MIGIIGKKLGMTQIFNEAGQQIPCTVIEAEPNSVLAVTSTSTLKAVQLGGLGSQKNTRANAKGEHTPRGRRVNNAELGHAKKAGLDAAPRVVRSARRATARRARRRIRRVVVHRRPQSVTPRRRDSMRRRSRFAASVSTSRAMRRSRSRRTTSATRSTSGCSRWARW